MRPDRIRNLAVALSFTAALAACKTDSGSRVLDADAEIQPGNLVEFTIVQLNDIYEIGAVESGRRGGMARVATLRKKLLQENPQTVVILSGDFISPSAMGATKVDGKLVGGAHMIEVMNTIGVDYVTIGNHEFDNGEQVLLDRIGESQFKWVSSNVTNGAGQMYAGTLERTVREFSGTGRAQGAKARVCFFGVTVEMVKKPFIKYRKPAEAAADEAAKCDQEADIVVALTHVSSAEDKEIAVAVPRIDISMGGHEHENMAIVAGDDNTPIFKADANARTVYVHRFKYDTATKKSRITSQLVEIDESIPEDQATAAVVEKWTKRVFESLRTQGVEPEEVVGNATEVLDGFEASVRNRPTNLTALIGQSFLKAEPEADAAVFGSGSIRLDDRLAPGHITQFDIVRIFPFGGKNILVSLKGDVLKKALDAGLMNKGSGGYLCWANIVKGENGDYQVKGAPLDPAKEYKILFNDFLLTGMEKNLSFLNPELEANGITKVHDSKDVRTALIDHLKTSML